MAKRIIYAQSELIDMNLAELRTVVERESERINRQLSRARKRGVDLESLFTQGELERPLRQKKLDRWLNKLSEKNEDLQAELMKMYARISRVEFTKEGVAERVQEREEIAKDIGLDDPTAITPDLLSELRKQKEVATGTAGAFYQLLIKSVESGTETDYNFFRTDNRLYLQTLTPEGRQEFIKDQIKKINKVIRETNKQRDDEGVAKKEELVTQARLRRDARAGVKAHTS